MIKIVHKENGNKRFYYSKFCMPNMVFYSKMNTAIRWSRVTCKKCLSKREANTT